METTLFRCAECGYRADVLGASVRETGVKRKSMVCRSCKAVVVAVVATLAPGETEFGLSANRWTEVVAVCPHCAKGGLMPWPPTHPCPRCHNEMDEN